MEIVGFEKLSLVDYDGYTSCTLFTGGCNFRCPFCHNGDVVLNHKSFTKIDEQEIIDYLKKRKGLLDGIVVSGGEPTLQKDLPDFLKSVKEIGYLVKLDTNGTNPAIVKSLIDEKLVDYIAMDVKSSKQGYQKTIGLKGFPENVGKSVSLLLQNVVDYEFRVTLVDELITEKDIIQMANWLKGAKRLYLQCFIERDGCIKKGLHQVPKEQALKYKQIFIDNAINAELRNYE